MDKKVLKIMWVVGFTPEKIGAFEESIFYITEECLKKGFKIFFIFPGNPIQSVGEKLSSLGAKIFILPIKKRIDLKFIKQAIILIKKEKMDILHSCFDLANFNSYFAALLSRVPIYIWHQRNLMGESLPLLRRVFLKFLGSRADKIIAVSDAVKNDLILKGASREKVERIYNGINIEKFNLTSQAESDKLKKEFNVSADSIVLISVGQARPEKGLIFLVKAFSAIAVKHPSSILLVIGGKNGPCYGELRSEAEKLEISDRVFFTEMRSDVPDLLHISDILILPSLLEALANSVLEGMAASKAVIATRIGGVPEIVMDGENGILVAPKDSISMSNAIDRLISNPSLRKQMGEAGRRIVEEKFNLKNSIERLFDLYKRLIQSKT